MRRPVLSVCLLLACSTAVADPPVRFISGRVVTADGRPVADVDVSSYWSANGWKRDASGKVVGSLGTEADRARMWANEGQMEPTRHPVRTGPDGTFRLESGSRDHHVLVMGADRLLGGLGIVPVGAEDRPITIVLGPLVRVQGQIRGPVPGDKPPWTHIYTERAEEPERPTDSYRVAGCGSFGADFAMLLPAGRYRFQAYNDPDQGQRRGQVEPYPELSIVGTEGSIDLGTLQLSPAAEALVPRMLRVIAEQHITPLKDRVGQAPPPIIAADSRGIARDWQAGQARGKWQVLEFWGMNCTVCLNRSLPDLIRFQEEHAAQADRFEIVSVFMDVEGKVDTVAKLDDALKPIIKHVWGGKTLPFPTLVDPSYRTSESWGLAGYGDMVLIGPDGKIVAGDLETLRGILDKK